MSRKRCSFNIILSSSWMLHYHLCFLVAYFVQTTYCYNSKIAPMNLGSIVSIGVKLSNISLFIYKVVNP